MSDTFIGRNIENNTIVEIGDIERRSGLYILGNPGTGKSNLMESMIITDIQKGSGVFFLDPHGEAIDKIIKHLTTNNTHFIIILDPEDEKYSFGINPLSCRDLTSLKERTDTYTRAYNIFYKLWKNILDERPWIQLIVQNTLYALIENPEYTLAEMPLFLTDENFLYQLASNIKYNLDVRDFWLNRFRNRRGSEQQRQADATLTRISTLLGQPHIRHIISQKKTTIDFSDILAQRKHILLKLSASLAPDIKKFIGTIVVSELLHAVRNRPEDKRKQFCVYIDEFQNFANSEDLAIFITEARKYGIATTIAHQERHGQLSDNMKIQGATLSAANKVFFQLTVKNAGELASEFAREPPTETRLEEQQVISQNPVSDLLRGHSNAQIRGFVSRYLRPLQERIEDIKEHMDEERLIRDDQRDLAAIDRIEAQMMGVNYYRSQHYAALQRVISFLLFARAQTAKLLNLHQSVKELRSVIRGFNRFLSAIMEGSIAQGQEQFSQFLIRIIQVHEFSLVPQQYAPALELYISLKYGDSKAPRAIPFALAREEQVFSSEVALLTHQAEEEFKREKEAVWQQIWKRHIGGQLEYVANEPERAKKYQEKVLELICQIESKLKKENCREEASQFEFSEFARRLTLIYHYPSLAELFKPYYTARFAASWRDRLPDVAKTLSWMLDWIEDQRDRAEHGLRYFKHYNPPPGWFKQWFISGPAYDSNPEGDLYDIDLLNWLEQFLKRHGEGAIVILVLLMSLVWPKKWFSSWCYSPNYYSAYNMLYVPALMNKEPLEILLFLNKTSDFLSRLDVKRDCCKYMWQCLDWYGYYKYDWARGAPRERFSSWPQYEDNFYSGKKWRMEVTNELEEHPDIKLLGQLLSKTDSQYPVLRERWWKTLEKLVQLYLMHRACYLARLGQKIADKAFPQSAIQGASHDKISSVVTFMADALQEEISRQLNQIQQGHLAKLKSEAQDEFDSKMHNKSMSLPVHLPYRQLNENEIELLKRVCVAGLVSSKDWDGKATLTVIEEFAQFCTLLSKPENHIKIRTGQFVEKQVYIRTTSDMKEDMVQELTRLDRFEAWTKTLKPDNKVLKGKIRTVSVSDYHEDNEDYLTNLKIILERSRSEYCIQRILIEEEIMKRQAKWRASRSSPPAQKKTDKEITDRQTNPPPTSSSI